MARKMNMDLPSNYDGRATSYRVDSMKVYKGWNSNRQPDSNFRLDQLLKTDLPEGKLSADGEAIPPSEEYVCNVGNIKIWALVIFTAAFFVYTFIHFDLQAKHTSQCPTPEERAAAGIVVPTDITKFDC